MEDQHDSPPPPSPTSPSALPEESQIKLPEQDDNTERLIKLPEQDDNTERLIKLPEQDDDTGSDSTEPVADIHGLDHSTAGVGFESANADEADPAGPMGAFSRSVEFLVNLSEDLNDASDGDKLPCSRVSQPASMHGRLYVHFDILSRIDLDGWSFASEMFGCFSESEPLWRVFDRSLGSILGMVLGNSLGGPLKGTPQCEEGPRPRCIFPASHSEVLTYEGATNKFNLKSGQWGDVAAMGLCLLDSLLSNHTFSPSDLKMRWYYWWQAGYNNGFGADGKRTNSVGLRPCVLNILRDLKPYQGEHWRNIPVGIQPSDDSTSSCLGRLAPLAVCFQNSMHDLQQSTAYVCRMTHDGVEATAFAQFVAFFTSRALQRGAGATGRAGPFVDRTVEEFVRTEYNSSRYMMTDARQRVLMVLSGVGDDPRTAHWDWRAASLAPLLAAAEGARGSALYLGLHSRPGSIGEHSCDAMAMALWSIYHSNSLEDAMLRAVNLLGAADVVGAIAGSMAGAFYGYSALATTIAGESLLESHRQWDAEGSLHLRALALCARGAVAAPHTLPPGRAPVEGIPLSSSSYDSARTPFGTSHGLNYSSASASGSHHGMNYNSSQSAVQVPCFASSSHPLPLHYSFGEQSGLFIQNPD